MTVTKFANEMNKLALRCLKEGVDPDTTEVEFFFETSEGDIFYLTNTRASVSFEEDERDTTVASIPLAIKSVSYLYY